MWGVRGRALSHPRPLVLSGVRPGPASCWPWVRCAGVGARLSLGPCPVPRFFVCCVRFPGSRHPVAVVAWHLSLCRGCGWRRTSLACLVAPRWCAAPRPVRSLSVLRLAFPSPWCLPPPRGLSPPALLGGCAGHVEARREPGSLCLPLAPAEARALGALRVVSVRGPAMGLSLAGPSGFGLALRALRWFGVCGPGHCGVRFPVPSVFRRGTRPVHRGCLVWTPTPPLAGRRTPGPGPTRVCVRALLNRVGRAGLPAAFWCASPFLWPFSGRSLVVQPPPGRGCPVCGCCWVFFLFFSFPPLVAPSLRPASRVFRPQVPWALASCRPRPPPFFPPPPPPLCAPLSPDFRFFRPRVPWASASCCPPPSPPRFFCFLPPSPPPPRLSLAFPAFRLPWAFATPPPPFYLFFVFFPHSFFFCRLCGAGRVCASWVVRCARVCLGGAVPVVALFALAGVLWCWLLGLAVLCCLPVGFAVVLRWCCPCVAAWLAALWFGAVCLGVPLPCAVLCCAVLSCAGVLSCSAFCLRRCLCLLFVSCRCCFVVCVGFGARVWSGRRSASSLWCPAPLCCVLWRCAAVWFCAVVPCLLLFFFFLAGGAGFQLFPCWFSAPSRFRVVSVSVLCLCGAVLVCLRRCSLFGALLPSRGWLVFCVVACCVCVFAVGPGCPLLSPGGSWWLLVSCLGGVLWCVPGCCAAPCCCALCRLALRCCALCCFVLLCLVLPRAVLCPLALSVVLGSCAFWRRVMSCPPALCVFCCCVSLRAVVRRCALCRVRPGVSCCAFPVVPT